VSGYKGQAQPQAPAPVTDQPAAASPEATTAAPTASAAPARSVTTPTSAGLAQQYCEAIVDQAADARFAWQKKLIADMERELEKRTALLEEKVAEYQKWVARRDQFVAKANDGLVRIYARMRAEAAAGQLAELDEETAAAVINKLDPKVASQILNEMEPARAARLVGVIAGAAKVATRTENKP
jgi:flagellar motility protein MotE (MotC chaperone)